MLLIHNRRLQVVITTTTIQTSRAAYLRTLQREGEREKCLGFLLFFFFFFPFLTSAHLLGRRTT